MPNSLLKLLRGPTLSYRLNFLDPIMSNLLPHLFWRSTLSSRPNFFHLIIIPRFRLQLPRGSTLSHRLDFIRPIMLSLFLQLLRGLAFASNFPAARIINYLYLLAIALMRFND